MCADPVAAGDFPAQGFLGIDTDSNNHVDQVCSGTLVGFGVMAASSGALRLPLASSRDT